MKVGFLTQRDATDMRSWSGTPYFMGKALAENVGEVAMLSPKRPWNEKIYATVGKLQAAVTGVRLSPPHARAVARSYAAEARRLIAANDPDIVFLLAVSSAIDGVPDDRPLVYVSDATFRLIQDYYPRYNNLSTAARREADRLERETIRRADLLLYPSGWAARSAIEDYGADPGKIHVLPFGANIDPVPEAADPESRPTSAVCRLLFVGVDWALKGAEIAVDALDALQAAGVAAELTICGCTPPRPIDRPGLTIIPFLDKNDPAQRDRLVELYRSADFFILPTRAECFGIVFCEAAAYGVPSLGPATGGVPNALLEGRSGHLLPHDASGADYGTRIAEIYRDRPRHLALRRSSRAAFEADLNWKSWGQHAAPLIQALSEGGKSP